MDIEILNTIRGIASRLAETLEVVYTVPRVMEALPTPAADEFVRLSVFEKSMKAEGFRFVGDFADRTLEQLGEDHMIRYRVALHPNGAYLLQYIFDGQRIIDIGHYFEKSGGISTTNAWASRHLDSMSGWDVHFVTPDKTWEEIWSWHIQRLDAALIRGEVAEKIVDLDAYLALSSKKVLKDQIYRQSIPGYVREHELQAYLEQPKDIREQFYKELIRTTP